MVDWTRYIRPAHGRVSLHPRGAPRSPGAQGGMSAQTPPRRPRMTALLLQRRGGSAARTRRVRAARKRRYSPPTPSPPRSRHPAKRSPSETRQAREPTSPSRASARETSKEPGKLSGPSWTCPSRYGFTASSPASWTSTAPSRHEPPTPGRDFTGRIGVQQQAAGKRDPIPGPDRFDLVPAGGLEGGHRHLGRGRLVRDGLAVVCSTARRRTDRTPACRPKSGRFGHYILYANTAVA